MGDFVRAAAAALVVTALAGGWESDPPLSVQQTVCKAAAGLTEAGYFTAQLLQSQEKGLPLLPLLFP